MAASVAGCSSRKEPDAAADAAEESVALPVIPDSIAGPGERAAWLCGHFWDNLDMADRSRSLDTAYMEQSFANFASVLPLTGTDEREQAVTTLMQRAEKAGPDVRGFVLHIAELYLYEPASPMYDESLYAPFARYAAAHVPDKAVAARAALEDIARNAPGTLAPDLHFLRPDGTTGSLLQPGSHAGILLFFHEPGCERCRNAAGILAADATVGRAVADGALRVVMLCPDPATPRRLWLEDAAGLPPGWETGLDTEGEADDGYTIRATPSFYLLHPDGTVVLKDAPLAVVMKILTGVS